MTRLPDFARVQRLRDLFLEERGGQALTDYWRDARDLDAYDAVLGARIGWKWDAALRECSDRGWQSSPDDVVLDFGCGAGVAARRYLQQFGAREVLCHDRSAQAMKFAVKQLRAQNPDVLSHTRDHVRDVEPDVLLVSHVLGELDERGFAQLESLIARSRRVLIVEPGNREVSRRLSELRDRLLDDFAIVAPCPHMSKCPSLHEDNDWCHFFATPPGEVFTTGFWAKTAQELSIDLRSLPYAFLALDRDAAKPQQERRLLGRAQITPHLARVRACTNDEVAIVEFTKRNDKATWRALKKNPELVRKPGEC